MTTVRDEAVADLFRAARDVQGEGSVVRKGVDSIAESLLRLAGRRDLFPLEDFPLPRRQTVCPVRLGQGRGVGVRRLRGTEHAVGRAPQSPPPQSRNVGRGCNRLRQ